MRVFFWITVAALVACVAAKADEKKIVCYFGSWAVYRPGNGLINIANDIDPTLCTHLIYTFIGIHANADVVILDKWADLPDGGAKNGYTLFNQLRGISPNTKTLIAVGGWTQESKNYSIVSGDPELRVKLADNLVRFTRKYGFDGLDFDWEYPNQREGVVEDRENYVLLLQELRKRCDDAGLILTAAVGGAASSAEKSYIIPEVVKYLDLVNLMIYDLHGQWDGKTGINAPLYPGSWETGAESLLNVNESINYWLSQGATRDKLVLGIPTYGRTFTLQDSKDNGIGAPTTGPGTPGPYTREDGNLGYNEICEMQLNDKDWEVHFQEEQRVPYAVKGDQWVGYDNVESVREKAELVKSLDLAGAMIWSIETDDFKGICGAKYPILKTLNHVLRDGPALPPITTTTEAPPHVEPECTSVGYVRDFYDCTVFYNCMDDGKGGYNKFKLQCPNGQYFDETTKLCDDPAKVDCEPKSRFF